MRQYLFKVIATIAIMLAGSVSQAQPSYVIEQIGRDAHQIVQSLGAFVGNERAESSSFDITYMPAGASVEGIMIINTADYRCKFMIDPAENTCTKIEIDIRSVDFQRDFNTLFQIYKTESISADTKKLNFGNSILKIEESASTSTRFRKFKISQIK